MAEKAPKTKAKKEAKPVEKEVETKKAKTQDPLEDQERSKYERMWAVEDYRRTSPAQRDLERFFSMCEALQPQTVLDLGCGTGRAALELFLQGMQVAMVDIAANCLDPEVRSFVDHPPEDRKGQFTFTEACAWDLKPALGSKTWDWVFCFDVMEHIPEERVDAVLEEASRHMVLGGFFQICTTHDGFGRRIGETLHLTVKPNEWWLEKLGKHFEIVRHEWNPAHLYVRVKPKG